MILTQAHGIGLGNQIQFIPALMHLKSLEYDVYSDSVFYHQIGLCRISEEKPDVCYVLMYPDFKSVVKIRYNHLSWNIYGFKYDIKKYKFGLGYSTSVHLDWNQAEYVSYLKMIGNKAGLIPFHLDGHKPMDKKIIFGISQSKDKEYKYWDRLFELLTQAGYEIYVYGDMGITGMENKKAWFDNYKDMLEEFKTASFYFGVDNGLMHLADILNIPKIILWGNTPFLKNAPRNYSVILKIDDTPNKIYNLFRNINDKL